MNNMKKTSLSRTPSATPRARFSLSEIKALRSLILGLGILFFEHQSQAQSEVVQVTFPETALNMKVWTPLSWEAARPEGINWSLFSFEVLEQKAPALLNEARDIENFCPKYSQLTAEQRLNTMGQLISAMTKFESGYNPLSRMKEDLGTDPITRQQVRSEGLLQLSYQDTLQYKFCEFDWTRDKNLREDDPQKTILDPFRNLSCGIQILNAQVQKYHALVISKGAYWSVLKSNSKYNKIKQIQKMVRSLPFCG